MSEDRLNALKRAEWRTRMKKGGYGQCRLCGGRTEQKKPYCIRHWKCLNGYPAFYAAAARGDNLEEADALISLRVLWRLRRDPTNDRDYLVGFSMRLHEHGNSWSLFLIRPTGEALLGRFHLMAQVMAYLQANKQTHSIHNRYAKKALIR